MVYLQQEKEGKLKFYLAPRIEVEEPTSHQHSFSDAQNVTTLSANTAKTSSFLTYIG